MKATFVRDLPAEDWNGHAQLFKLDQVAKTKPYDETETPLEFEYIIVSAAVVAFSGPETYLFPGDENGQILAWGELPGSYRGGLHHMTAVTSFESDYDDWQNGVSLW